MPGRERFARTADAEIRLGAGHRLSEVAEIAGSPALGELVADIHIQQTRRLEKQIVQFAVGLARLVGDRDLVYLEGGAGHQRRAFDHLDEAPLHFIQQRFITRADIEAAAAALGDDIRRRSPVGDDAVDERLRRHLLPVQPHRIAEQDQRVERIQSLFRTARRMRRPPVKHRVVAADAGRAVIAAGGVTVVVRHHHGIHAVQAVGVPKHQHFAAAALLGGSSQHDDRAADVVFIHIRPGGDRGGDTGDPDQIVPAGVSDPFQRVVFGGDREGRPGRAAGILGAKRGRHPRVGIFDRKTARFQQIDQKRRRFELGERHLGIFPDAFGRIDENLSSGFDIRSKFGNCGSDIHDCISCCDGVDFSSVGRPPAIGPGSRPGAGSSIRPGDAIRPDSDQAARLFRRAAGPAGGSRSPRRASAPPG